MIIMKLIYLFQTNNNACLSKCIVLINDTHKIKVLYVARFDGTKCGNDKLSRVLLFLNK